MFKVIEQNITQHILYNKLITPFPYVRNDRWLMINLNQISMINYYFSEKIVYRLLKRFRQYWDDLGFKWKYRIHGFQFLTNIFLKAFRYVPEKGCFN